jgi:anti-anti-sigma regulatory factor
MLKIEKSSDGSATVLKLIGRIQSEHLGELRAQIASCGTHVVLDLEGVTLVDAAVIRFLGASEKKENQTPPLLTLYPRVDPERVGRELSCMERLVDDETDQ